MCAICDGKTYEEVLDEHRSLIEEGGWSHVMVVGDVTRPPFVYTVGLTRLEGHPEVVVSGPDLDTACGVLHSAAEAVVEGERFAAGREVDLDGVPLRVVAVRRPAHLVVAQDIYATPGHAGLVPALQLVWPDDAGRWPWEVPWREARTTQEVFGSSPWQ